MAGHGRPGGVGIFAATDYEARAARRGIAASGLAGEATIVECGIACRDIANPAIVSNYSAVISTGFAGGLRPDVPPSAVVVPREVCDETGEAVPIDTDWHAQLLRTLVANQQPVVDPLVQVRKVVATPAEKSAASEGGKFAAVDMESAIIGAACRDAGIPFVVLRVVLDDHETTIPEAIIRMASPGNALTPWPVLGAMLRETTATRDFIRQSFAARRALIELLGSL